jgi:seryl-tRNA synthetase
MPIVKNTIRTEIELARLEIIPAMPIPDHLTGEVQSKLAYVDELIASAQVPPSGDQIVLRLRQPAGSLPEGRRAELENKVQRVVTSMVKGAFKPKIQVLEDHLDRPTPFSKNPMSELAERGEISQEAPGVYSLGPLMTRLIGYFEGCFLDLAASFGAQPYRFPTLIPARYLERVNYFRAFPHSLTFVTHLREDLDAIDHFSQHAGCDEAGALNTPPASFAQVQTLLSPAVCYHLYFALADRPLPGGKLAATAVGNCFRYEAINLVSLERLWNFTMREVIFVGPKEYVLENREIARERMHSVLEETGLAYRVESANDPFFIGEFRKQAAFQSAFQLKYEIRARLPFKERLAMVGGGASPPSTVVQTSTLAVGSYNYHQDFFGRNLNISLPDGSPAHTGCVAFGLERIAFAFLAQHGLDPAGWPVHVRESFDNPSTSSGCLLRM